MARYFLLSLTFILWGTLAVAQSAIAGKISDGDTGEEFIGANVVISKSGVFVIGASTDFEGNYKVNVDPGTYDVEVSYIGYATKRIEGVIVTASKVTNLDVEFGADEEGLLLEEVVVTGYSVPLIEQDNTTSGSTITAEEIRTLPTKNITALAATAAGLSQVDEGEDVTVRGSRADATDYYVDGIRVSGNANLVPQSEIDQLQVITGGIEAQYGDVVGGIISITTKGPSGKFTGSFEAETSEYLDSYGYNLLSANLSGPILKNSKGIPILGFRLAAQYRTRKDDDPAAVDMFRISDEKLAELNENPVTLIPGGGRVPTAQFLKDEDIEVLDYRPNERDERLDLTAKLDARLSDAIDITLSGSYNTSEDQFTPGSIPGLNTAPWDVLNSHRNPTTYNTRYRANFRFRHRLGGNTVAVNEDEEESTKKGGAVFRNAQYILQFAYEKTLNELYDKDHEFNFFDYGYIGRFDYEYDPTIITRFNQDLGVTEVAHVDYETSFTGYTPSDINAGMTAYNGVVDADQESNFIFINGRVQEQGMLSIWSNMHTTPNMVYNFARKLDNDRITVNANTSFDFLPGGSESGRHSIQFGLLYEQRFNRGHSLRPFALWEAARAQANRHLAGVDSTAFVGRVVSPVPFLVDSVDVFKPQSFAEDFDGNLFFRNVRGLTNSELNDFVNVDAINPSDLSLGMFSAGELNDVNALLGLYYYGYSFDGQKLGNDVKFDDFFTARDERGVRTFPVAAFQPIYAAGYIQDRFSFKDIIFRVGLRLDYYDANTKVLKDPFSLYEVMNAEEFYNTTGQERPVGVEDNYLVYTTSADAVTPTVKAFRVDEQWYFANGAPANDGNVIFGSDPVFPYYKDQNADIRSESFDPNTSFEDYEPQLNWMPRLAFSFPISDAANFFAHYDILVQRPSNTLATALDYYYFIENPGDVNNPLNNPALRPQRTIDYEVGFQQKLSNSSAIKLAAYYKESRDMIQRRTYLYVPTVSGQYVSFDNQDFGTVKGFTFQYDLRRTNNVRLNINYTLQFADGTGSDANSQRNLSARGNLRTLYPLNFDERHRIVTTIDYRYGSGKRYNGPRLFGKDILSNFGANLQTIAVSGRPYTATSVPQQFGGSSRKGELNGARLPWNFTVNLRVDKTFNLSSADSKKNLSLNIYLRVQNLLDQRNVLGVYSASGSADDDGFLATPLGRQALEQAVDQEAFLAAYRWRLINPDLFSLPRRIFLGAEFFF